MPILDPSLPAPKCSECGVRNCKGIGRTKDGRKKYNGRCVTCKRLSPQDPLGNPRKSTFQNKLSKPIVFSKETWGASVELMRNSVIHQSVCEKRPYTKKIAQTAANKRMHRGVAYLRIYQCDICNWWHLTHNKSFKGKIKIDDKWGRTK